MNKTNIFWKKGRFPECRNQAPDTEEASRSDTEMKHPQTQDIMRRNESRADALAFYYLMFCRRSQNHIKDKNMHRLS